MPKSKASKPHLSGKLPFLTCKELVEQTWYIVNSLPSQSFKHFRIQNTKSPRASTLCAMFRSINTRGPTGFTFVEATFLDCRLTRTQVRTTEQEAPWSIIGRRAIGL